MTCSHSDYMLAYDMEAALEWQRLRVEASTTDLERRMNELAYERAKYKIYGRDNARALDAVPSHDLDVF